MAQFNAYVTTDDGHRLTAESTVHVLTWDGIVTAPVPELAEVGGVMFWPRVAAALKSTGWRSERNRSFDESEPGKVQFNAEES
jgi:hypothetical protein